MFLLDTNVVSEMRRPKPSLDVRAWFESKPAEAHHLSVITLAELTHGAIAHHDLRQQHEIKRWIREVLRIWFPGRILGVAIHTGETAGTLIGIRQRAGKPLGLADALIAATAMEHHLVLVTRNVKDFADLPLDVYDPWMNKLILGNQRR